MCDDCDLPMFGGVKVESAGNCPLCKQKMVKHIIKEGARYHVPHWDTNGQHCSEKDCEQNHGYGKCVPLTPEMEHERFLRKMGIKKGRKPFFK